MSRRRERERARGVAYVLGRLTQEWSSDPEARPRKLELPGTPREIEELYSKIEASRREDWWTRLDRMYEDLEADGVPPEIAEELTRTAAIELIDVKTEERNR